MQPKSYRYAAESTSGKERYQGFELWEDITISEKSPSLLK
jgi:hypothetical protein